MDKSFYLSLANELSAKFGRVSSFVNHGPSIGAYHEEVLKSIIRHMLPDRFSLCVLASYFIRKGVPRSRVTSLSSMSTTTAHIFFAKATSRL